MLSASARIASFSSRDHERRVLATTSCTGYVIGSDIGWIRPQSGPTVSSPKPHPHKAAVPERLPAAPGKPETERVDVPVEETGDRILVAQAGSANSTRLRGADPNAYNRITVENGRATIDVRLWAGKEWRPAETARPEHS